MPADPPAPYGPPPFKVGELAWVNCPVSHYHGVAGEIFQVQAETGYVILDMPKGTELEREGIAENKILAEMKRAAKTRKTPLKRKPKGDPQWFPWSWLVKATRE